jgi:TRAP-type C4-dicarboxylate transport system permease small subunit
MYTANDKKNHKKSILWIYRNIEVVLIIIFTFLLVFDVLLGILARYVHFDVVFSTELGKYLFIWLCAVGISAAAKDHKHIRLTYFVERIPVASKITWILSQILFLACVIFFFYWSLQLTIMQFKMEKSAMGFQFPMFWFTSALPIGFGLTGIRIIEDIIHKVKNKNQINPWDTSIESDVEF